MGEGAYVKKGNSWDYIDKEGNKIKKKDHDIKHLYITVDNSINYSIMDYLLTYNTPFDLNSTIKNRVLDIDSMLSTVFLLYLMIFLEQIKILIF